MTDNGACLFGAEVLRKHLRALELETKAVYAGAEDIEYVHRARVASRRLRASLPLFADCLPRKKLGKWLQQIRRVTRALGRARDTDVQIASVREFYQAGLPPYQQAGIQRLLLRLWQQRQKVQKPTAQAVKELQKSALFAEMRRQFDGMAKQKENATYTTTALLQLSGQAIVRQLDALLQYQEAVLQPENIEQLHALRIEAKALRYILEVFAPLYSSALQEELDAVRAAQELLGDIHDCDVWIDYLPLFLEQERQRVIEYTGFERAFYSLVDGITAFQQNRQLKRQATYNIFVQHWQGWQEQNLWDNLRRKAAPSFPDPEQIFPPLKASS